MKISKNLEKALAPLFGKVESFLSVNAKLVIGLAIVSLALSLSLLFQSNDIVKNSVMVTNIAGTSGGTGIVLDSNYDHSTILTNSHVCHVIEKGGLVSGAAGSYMVASYKHSQIYDLCMITVDGNLHAHTDIATSAPITYYENALISGHPALYPNVVTSGHFSGRRIIAVMRGLKPCTEEQKSDPSTAFLCFFAGGIPQVTQYDSTLVTATIMPGSSGSGVYNEKKQLAGVVFAGSGELAYAWTVPYESMKNFLDKEAATIEKSYPNNDLDLFSNSEQKKGFDEEKVLNKIKEGCAGENKEKLKNVCGLVNQDMIWHK